MARPMIDADRTVAPDANESRVAADRVSHRFQHAVTGADISAFQQLIRRVPIAEPVARYAVTLARTSRPGSAPM
jgi:hypothetical protein